MMEKFLERSALALSAAALGFSFYLFGVHDGFSYGASVMCDFVYSPIEGFWISHSDPYYILGFSETVVVWSMLAFLLMKLLEKGWVTSAILLIPLIVAMVGSVGTNRLIRAWLDDPNKYFDAFRETAWMSWIAFGMLAGSILVQAAVTVWKFLDSRSRRSLA